MAFAGDAVLVAHNARFDVGFVNRELERMTGKRVAATVIDTVPLARNLLGGRVERTSLASLAYFFGVSVQPCHRALPDAAGDGGGLLRLSGWRRSAAPRRSPSSRSSRRRAAAGPRRSGTLVHGAPARPGVYLFRDAHGQVLYVGKARDLRARLRSYFQTAASGRPSRRRSTRVEQVEWRVLGSELAAALEEVRLIRELRPPANARTPDARALRLPPPPRRARRRQPSPLLVRPVQAPRTGPESCRGTQGVQCRRGFDELLDGAVLDRLRSRLASLTEADEELEARYLRRRIGSLERAIAHLRRLEWIRELDVCVLAPSLEPGRMDAYIVSGGSWSGPGRATHACDP